MELKSGSRGRNAKEERSFNRTFMELKFPLFNTRYDWHSGFNRTFMELKFVRAANNL